MTFPAVEILKNCTIHLTSCLSLNYRRMPSLLEYLSYNCNFMGILAGPLCSYKDYITFIEGRSYQLQQSEANGKEDTKYEQTDPSPNVRCMTLAVLMLMESLHGKLGLHSSFTGITAELNLEFIHQWNSSLFKKLYAHFLKADFLHGFQSGSCG